MTDISLEPRYADESALYAGNELKFGDRVSLQYGVRYSYFRSLGPGTEYQYGN
jgi:outer membrane receptor for monomeric catechols